MNFDTWFVFAMVYLVTTISPGPNVLLVIKNSLRNGKYGALSTIFGNLTCQLFIVILVALGIGSIIAKTPQLFFCLKLCGGTYLIYLGIKNILSKDTSNRTADLESCEEGAISYLDVYKEGFLVSLSNPKTIIFLSAFMPQFLSTESPVHWQFALMFITIAIIVTFVHLIYAHLSLLFKARLPNMKMRNIFSKITGSVFIAMGGGVLFSSQTS